MLSFFLSFFPLSSTHTQTRSVYIYNEFPCMNAFEHKGYHANWELHHLLHVCISGGKDGIYVGGDDYTNDWIHKISSAVSIQAWNKDGGREIWMP